jgi:hypothetical protein
MTWPFVMLLALCREAAPGCQLSRPPSRRGRMPEGAKLNRSVPAPDPAYLARGVALCRRAAFLAAA